MQDKKKERKKTGWQELVYTITPPESDVSVDQKMWHGPLRGNDPTSGCWVLPNSINVTETLDPPLFLLPPCASWPFDLPEMVVDGQCVYADRHSLGRDDRELLAV